MWRTCDCLLIQASSVLSQERLAEDVIERGPAAGLPLVLGRGKRFFGEGTTPAAFEFAKSATSPSGVLISRYERAGEVKTGSFAMETSTAADLERRAKLT